MLKFLQAELGNTSCDPLQHDILKITPMLLLLSLEVLLKEKLEKAHFSSKSLLKSASPSFSSSSSFLPSGW